MAVTNETIPERIGAYEVLGILGRGGMGVVYLARDSRLQRNVAIKALPASLAADPVLRARFDREAKLLATFNHPNIAGIHGLEDVGDVRYLILEHVAGRTLAEILRNERPSFEEALRTMLAVARALETAHEAGIIHRDLKPGNIMVTGRRHVKVLDFGLARHADDASGSSADPPLTLAGHTTGTPGYMSPEQIRAGRQGPATDIFAFGCVLFECLTGTRAFPGPASQAITGALVDEPDWSALPEPAAGEITDLLRRCLDKDPDRRLGTIFEATDVLARRLDPGAPPHRTAAPAGRPDGLPRVLTSFIGRTREIEACGRLLRESGLVTLTGPGGSGKTRLALHLIESGTTPSGGRVWFVDLLRVGESARAASAIAATLGLREDSERSPEDRVVAAIGHAPALLCLDNCEHLLPGLEGLVSRLIQSCRELTVLATSREALALQGERVFPVPSMGLPAETATIRAEDAAGYEAVRLFVDRAALASPTFEWNDAAAPVVVDICRKLDGIPLAIELAAARIKMLSAEQINARLGDRFRLLTGGPAGDLSHHQTLLATIRWSYDHLSPAEQQLFRALSVFASGCTLEAAAAVGGPDRDEFEVLDRLTRLVDKSLVVVAHARGRAPRYRYLESVREYAKDKLEEAGEAPQLRERHLAYFERLVEESRTQLTKSEKTDGLSRLDDEHQNILAALSYCDEARDGARRGLELATSLWRFWEIRGFYTLGIEVLRAALARPGAEAHPQARATALYWTGFLAGRQGHMPEALRLIEESLDLARRTGDRRGEGLALNGLGMLHTRTGDFDTARRYRSEYLALCRDLGEKPLIATALNNLGDAEMQAGRFDAARPLLEESLSLGREVGDHLDLSLPLQNLGYVAIKQNDLAAAGAALEESLRLIGPLGARYPGGFALEYTGYLAAALGQLEVAARIIGAADAVRAGIGYLLTASEAEEHEREVARLRGALGEAAGDAALAAGRGLTFEEAFAEALRWYESGRGATD